MGRLNSRLKGLERRASASRPPRYVVISPAVGDEHPAGSIEPNPNGGGCTLFVAMAFAEDPERGLTARQREEIRAGDKVLVIVFTHEWRAGVAGTGGDQWQEPG